MSCKRISVFKSAIISRQLQKLIPEFTGFIRTLNLILPVAIVRNF